MRLLSLMISGAMFLFEDTGLEWGQIITMQNLADTCLTDYPELRGQTDDEICDWFQQKVASRMGVDLKRASIKNSVRINR